VIVTEWHSSELAEIQEVNRPWERGGALLFVESGDPPCVDTESYREIFNIDFSASVIEFTYESPVLESWNGQPALTQGRIWASFETDNRAFEKWYNAVVRWIRNEPYSRLRCGTRSGFNRSCGIRMVQNRRFAPSEFSTSADRGLVGLGQCSESTSNRSGAQLSSVGNCYYSLHIFGVVRGWSQSGSNSQIRPVRPPKSRTAFQ
jgi:hypothetical protein